MDGATFLSILRNDERRRSVPVILVTACDESELLAAAARLGVSKCLKKAHYTPQELLREIDQALAGVVIAQQNIRDDLARGPSEP
jgi:CheY-like chemotaxis protein